MEKNKKTENKENYRILSVFIDNILRCRPVTSQETVKNLTCWQIIAVKTGMLHLTMNGKGIILKKNDALIVRKGSQLVLKKLSDGECVLTIIEFDGNGVAGMMRYLGLPDIGVFHIPGSSVAVWFDNTIQYYEAGEFFRAALALQTMLITVRDTSAINYRISNLDRIYQYILEHYGEPLDLNQLANIYGTSVSYFSRSFKQFFDMAPMTFVNDVRIRQARVLLETTDMKIYDIAEKCGFEKLEYFCYVFKKSEGCTPTQYRANREHNE